MPDENTTARLEPRSADERPAASLLVRCWLEPNETPDEAPVLRGYVRNLRTGEERFIKDLDGVGRQILRSLEPAGAGAVSEGNEPLEAQAQRS